MHLHLSSIFSGSGGTLLLGTWMTDLLLTLPCLLPLWPEMLFSETYSKTIHYTTSLLNRSLDLLLILSIHNITADVLLQHGKVNRYHRLCT